MVSLQLSGSQLVGHNTFEGCIPDIYILIHNSCNFTVIKS